LMLMPIFLPKVPLTKPRTLCACQPVAFMISARVAPPERLISSSTLAGLLPWRAPAFFSLLATFFAPFVGFVGGLAFLVAFLPLGAPFFWVAFLLRGDLLRRDVGALCRNVGGCVRGSFCVRHTRSLFLRCVPRRSIHHSGYETKQEKSMRSWQNLAIKRRWLRSTALKANAIASCTGRGLNPTARCRRWPPVYSTVRCAPT
jgi:hypothetical protein